LGLITYHSHSKRQRADRNKFLKPGQRMIQCTPTLWLLVNSNLQFMVQKPQARLKQASNSRDCPEPLRTSSNTLDNIGMNISRSLENLLLTHSTGSTLRDTDAIPIARSAKRVVWGMAGKVCCLSNFLVNADEFYVDSWWWFPTQKYSPH